MNNINIDDHICYIELLLEERKAYRKRLKREKRLAPFLKIWAKITYPFFKRKADKDLKLQERLDNMGKKGVTLD